MSHTVVCGPDHFPSFAGDFEGATGTITWSVLMDEIDNSPGIYHTFKLALAPKSEGTRDSDGNTGVFLKPASLQAELQAGAMAG
jgi:hypothetical protein